MQVTLGKQILSFCMHKMIILCSHSGKSIQHIFSAPYFLFRLPEAQSLAIDSIRVFFFFSLPFTRAFHDFSFFPARLSLSSRYLACRGSRGNSRSKVHSRTAFRERLLLCLLLRLPRAGPKWIGGWKFTRHGFRSSFAPRSYGSRRSLERTARIEISRLDTSTRYSGRAEGNFSFQALSVASITPPPSNFSRGSSSLRRADLIRERYQVFLISRLRLAITRDISRAILFLDLVFFFLFPF